MLILSGTERELRHLMDTIDMFDIDWMAGMSAGVFTLQNSDVKQVMTELEKIVGDRNTSPITGILKIVPIERMNALLVVTPQPAYLDEVKKWIERLDKGGDGRRPAVLRLQPAEHARRAPGAAAAAGVHRPRRRSRRHRRRRRSRPARRRARSSIRRTFSPAGGPVAPGDAATGRVVVNQRPAAAPGGAQGTGIVRNLQVVADKDANTLLVIATAAEYSIIETALKKLDIPQRQVIIDVTIAEVTLTDELQFGVDVAVQGRRAVRPRSRRPADRRSSSRTRSTPPSALPHAATGLRPAAALAKGFTYIINNANFPGGIQAVLRLLDTYGQHQGGRQSPRRGADNQKATIKSGNRIPINQQTLVGGTTNAVTTTSQYIDTGVLLQVTPHINAGGLVIARGAGGGQHSGQPDVPSAERAADQHAVGADLRHGAERPDDGHGRPHQRHRARTAPNGIPFLSRIPILGGLFGNQDLKNDRTELVLFITPRVVENEFDMRGVDRRPAAQDGEHGRGHSR